MRSQHIDADMHNV